MGYPSRTTGELTASGPNPGESAEARFGGPLHLTRTAAAPQRDEALEAAGCGSRRGFGASPQMPGNVGLWWQSRQSGIVFWIRLSAGSPLT